MPLFGKVTYESIMGDFVKAKEKLQALIEGNLSEASDIERQITDLHDAQSALLSEANRAQSSVKKLEDILA